MYDDVKKVAGIYIRVSTEDQALVYQNKKSV